MYFFDREESTNVLTDEIENELNKFYDVLLIEKKVNFKTNILINLLKLKVREETQAKVYRMIEDIHSKLSTELIVIIKFI